MAKKKRKGSDKHKKDPGKKQKASRPPQGKQRQARRDSWSNQRRQVTGRARLVVIKVPEGAVLRGCKKTRRKLRAHLQLRAEVHSQLRVIASLFVLKIFITCLVGYPTPGYRSATEPPAVQPHQAPDAPPLPPLPPRAPAQPAPAQPASMECDIDSDSDSDCDSEPEPQFDSEAASPPHAHAVFEDPSNQALLAKLQDLGSINLMGDANTIDAHSMQLAVAMQQHYFNPGKWLDRDCNAALNMHRIGESKWRPSESCYWPDQGALPAKGKEYPGLGYKRPRDKPPKAQQQQQQQQRQPAVAQ
ncbi:hypothetical protein QJQ45_009624 [Haematococcus lacustris]|nr:hypothetical protein QJQ45_009624 [Haematococcus lacustris]